VIASRGEQSRDIGPSDDRFDAPSARGRAMALATKECQWISTSRESFATNALV
jgi:hypothetical protein